MSDAEDIIRRARQSDPFHGLDAEQRATLDAHIKARESVLKAEVQGLRRESRALEREVAQRENIIALHSLYQQVPRTAPRVGKRTRTRHPSGTATAVFLLSDHHIEEAVDPRVVGGLNAYNIDIAWGRQRQLARSIVWLMKAKRHEARIDNIVIALLGDFITGLVPTGDASILREVGPAKAAAIVQEMLAETLRYVRDHAGAERIVVPCIAGNHGRLTPKPSHSRSADWNIETYMLGQLAHGFDSDKDFEFIGTDDYCILQDIEGLRVRFQHGDGIRYGGGVGGIAIPINKARKNMNETPGQYADLDCMGHFHQSYDGGGFVVNGSLIGMTGYSRKGRFLYQPPEQIGFLVRPETTDAAKGSRGKVDVFKVFVS